MIPKRLGIVFTLVAKLHTTTSERMQKSIPSKDESSSVSSGDTASLQSPWEKHSPASKRKWKHIRNQILREDQFYEALGMMGIDYKTTNVANVSSIKMPPLDPPDWFRAEEEDLLTKDPPHVGPQVPRPVF